MKIIEEKRRELFEAWCIENHGTMGMPSYPEWCLEKNLNGKYSSLVIQGAWDGFNAALDAVVIDLPGERRVRNGWPEGCGADMAFNDCRELCVDAIEATGLGLKVKI